MRIEENINLSEYTTIKLGGHAKYFTKCENTAEIKMAMEYAKQNAHQTFILGGGSNIVFSDSGFNGLIIKIAGTEIKIISETNESVEVYVSAGTEWDKFVEWSVEKGFTGIECLSGIPGCTGAVPIQNVGAYGQEVSSSIKKLHSINKENFEEKFFINSECNFDYRHSIFKEESKEKFIITGVEFELSKTKDVNLKYPDLKKQIEQSEEYINILSRVEKLQFIRCKVIEIRKQKGMVVDETDTDSVSCGSFFTNPVISYEDYKDRLKRFPDFKLISSFSAKGGIKLSAAKLIEVSGFSKGYFENGVGISGKHSLALINKGGTSNALIALAEKIQSSVYKKFEINMQIEPVVV